MKALSNYAECPKCGSGHKSKPFCIYANGWHCFACGYTKASDRGYTVYERRISIPEWPEAHSDYSKFNISVQQWLIKYFITQEQVKKYKIMSYNDDVFLLNLDEEEKLISYQQRNVITRNIRTFGQKSPTLLNKLAESKILVIVEDFISAIRINAQYPAVCLWGTKLGKYVIDKWFKTYDTILVWLDNDKEKETNSGQDAANIIINMGRGAINRRILKNGFSVNNKNIINILSEQDPKCYTNTEITQFIEGVLYATSN